MTPSESARERAERWIRENCNRMSWNTLDLAALLDEHARAELEAAAREIGESAGINSFAYENILRARAARIGGGE